jgi:hypothetical protein
MLYRDTLESIPCPHLRGADRCGDAVAVEVRPSSVAMGPILGRASDPGCDGQAFREAGRSIPD